MRGTHERLPKRSHRVRSRAIASLGNELHGLLAEMGIIVAKGRVVFRHSEVRQQLTDHRERLDDDLFMVLDDVLDQWLAPTPVGRSDELQQFLPRGLRALEKLLSASRCDAIITVTSLGGAVVCLQRARVISP